MDRESPPTPTLRIPLEVTPSAAREGVTGWLGDALKVRVRASAARRTPPSLDEVRRRLPA